MPKTTDAPKSYWFVGASYGRTEDQTPRFLSEGIWENGYDDKQGWFDSDFSGLNSMRPWLKSCWIYGQSESR